MALMIDRLSVVQRLKLGSGKVVRIDEELGGGLQGRAYGVATVDDQEPGILKLFSDDYSTPETRERNRMLISLGIHRWYTALAAPWDVIDEGGLVGHCARRALGRDLRSYLRGGWGPPVQNLLLSAAVALAVEALHAHGMTHGDPKRGGRHGDHGLTIARDSLQPIFQFIEKSVSEDKPFFIWYAPFLPHTPHNPPQSILDKYIAPARPLAFSKYYAMCEWFDQSCGNLLDYLDDKNLTNNTIVLYVCDNGWIQTEKSRGRNFIRGKQSPYDGGIRTPIMIRYPPALKPKMDTHTLVSSIDIAPTILAAAGLDIPTSMPGINLLDSNALAERKNIFGQIFSHNAVDIHNPVSSLRYRWSIEDRWKLIWPNKPLEPNAQIELYDLIADPYEKIDLAAIHPKKVKKLKSAINQWWSLN
ncbi:MAG: sulfatase-like hydrolase/transferase [Planctomycetes bacterium]|nr:sulfatase-like hydrolase/transferase [Planctomycetota bacterium]